MLFFQHGMYRSVLVAIVFIGLCGSASYASDGIGKYRDLPKPPNAATTVTEDKAMRIPNSFVRPPKGSKPLLLPDLPPSLSSQILIPRNTVQATDIAVGDITTATLTAIWLNDEGAGLVRAIVNDGPVKGAVLLGERCRNPRDTTDMVSTTLVQFHAMSWHSKSYRISATGLLPKEAMTMLRNQRITNTAQSIDILFMEEIDLARKSPLW